LIHVKIQFINDRYKIKFMFVDPIYKINDRYNNFNINFEQKNVILK